MKALDSNLLKKFIKLAGTELTGEWILIGGTVLPSLGITHRTTTDIDLIGLKPEQQSQTLKLMELAEKLELPIETINQAGSYFLSKIQNFEKQLVILHKGPSATVYRPNVTLFLLLKIPRLSDADFSDCLEYIKVTSKLGEFPDVSHLNSAIKKELGAEIAPEKIVRLKSLRDLISSRRS